MHFGYWKPSILPWSRQKMLEAMNDLVFESLQLDRHASGFVVDLGCGLGAVSNYASPRFPKLRFEAVSISPEQISEGQRRFSHENLSIREADYHALPWDDSSVDAAFFLESLCHSPSPEIVIAEVFRVLRPGGRLVIVDGQLKRPWKKLPRYYRWMEQAVAQNWAVPQFHHHQAIRDHAVQSGFQLLDCRELSFRIAPCVAHSPFLTLSHAVKLLLRGHATRRQWQHLAACGLSLVLGMHLAYFGYYLISFQKK